MKKLIITRMVDGNHVTAYRTRGLDTVASREMALQNDCDALINSLSQDFSKEDIKKIAKIVLRCTAEVHSDIERILRNHGKKESV